MATLTASAALAIQTEAQNLWEMDKVQAVAQWGNPVTTVKKVVEMQSLKMHPLFSDADRCVSLKVWHPDMSDIMTGGTLYNSTVPDPDATCAPAGCESIGSLTVTLAPNVFLKDCFSVDDALCGNDFDFARQVAMSMQGKMQVMRTALNTRMIQFINTNAGANVATADATANGWTIASGNTTIPAVQWTTADILMKLNITGAKNRIPEGALILDGTNLLLQSELAPYLGLNSDDKSTGALYDSIARRYNADMLNLDAIVTTNSTFWVNPNMVGFYNRSRYTANPVQLESNIQVFSVTDPLLRYRFVPINANGVQTGPAEMRPVTYDILYTKSCNTTRDATGRVNYTHKFELMFEGAIILGPVGVSPNHTTGILKFTKGA